MDSLVTFCKENFDFIILLFSLLGVIIGFISLIYELKKRRSDKNDEHRQSKE